MARLRVDKNLMIKEFKEKLKQAIDESRERLESDIKQRMGSNSTLMTFGLARDYGDLKTTLDTATDIFKLYIDGNAITLFNNYGSGSKMDVDGNALINEYIGNENWNPRRSRNDTTIRGRPEGDYTDLLGKRRHSQGTWENVNLEGRMIPNWENDGEGYIKIEPQAPSHAIEYGISWYVLELDSILSRAYNSMDFSKCFIYK